MKSTAGVLSGLGLIVFGALGAWLVRQPLGSSPALQFCRMDLCPSEFSEPNVLLLTQAAQIPADREFALRSLKQAVVDTPAYALRWTDLGSAEAEAGHAYVAKECYGLALKLAPNSPVVRFRAANFAWVSGDAPQALKVLRPVLENPQLEKFYTLAFLTYSRLNLPPAAVLDQGMPPLKEPAAGYLRFYLHRGNSEEAAAVYAWMARKGLAAQDIATEYSDFLIRQKRPLEAARVWTNGAPRDSAFLQGNWIYNGEFKLKPAGGPFDWNIDENPQVATDRVEYAGVPGFAMRSKFEGADSGEFTVMHTGAAVGIGRWEVSALVKADGFSMDEGVKLRAFAPNALAEVNVSTETAAGTADWRRVRAILECKTQARFLRVEVVHVPSLVIRKARGSSWVADVHLSPLK